MAQVTGYTAPRMKEIEDSAIVDGDVVGNDLILKRFDGQLINAGNVRGLQGIQGPVGPTSIAVVTSTTRPASPSVGLMIYETDTNKIYTWNGTVWVLPRNVAGGIVGQPGVSTADQAGITAETDLVGLTTATVVGASRRVKVSFQVMLSRTVLDGYTVLRIKEGAVSFASNYVTNALAGFGDARSGFVILTPTAGAHTYKLSLERLSGTGTVASLANAAYPANIIAEDIGGV